MIKKRILKSLIPPLLLDTIRWGFFKAWPRYFWEGIYSRFSDVPVRGQGHEGNTWISESVRAVEQLIQRRSNDKTISEIVSNETSLLPFLVALIGRNQSNVTVLDFGGGAGVTYVSLKSGIYDKIRINYLIVEQEAICKEGRKIFERDHQVHFSSTIPNHLPAIDIIYLGSSLQYVENDHELLAELVRLNPQYFLFVNAAIGDVPTYVSAQKNIKGTILPYRFTNVSELLSFFGQHGYDLLFSGVMDDVYDQDNFSPEYRLPYHSNLLLGKKMATKS